MGVCSLFNIQQKNQAEALENIDSLCRPIEYVQAFFNQAGMQSTRQNSTDTTTNSTVTTLNGFYPCDNPPDFAFQFPSMTNASTARSTKSTVVTHNSSSFKFSTDSFAQRNSKIAAEHVGQCMASVHGTDGFGDSWILGQRESRGMITSFPFLFLFFCFFVS